jgi:hemoglobin-like flavoprotein
MSLNVPLLRSSFELVIERQPELTTRFYVILFERFPQVKPLFGRNSGANQAQMLTSALAAVLEHLEDAPWLTQTLGAMGKKHVDYGVTEEMYGFVVESLISALAEAAGDDWSLELEQAWTDALHTVGGLMQAGAKSAAA